MFYPFNVFQDCLFLNVPHCFWSHVPLDLQFPALENNLRSLELMVFKVKSDSLPMCSWRQPANTRGTQQTNALLQPTSFCVNWRNERSLTRLPSLFLRSILQVLPWQTCMIKSAKQQGANMTRTGPTQLRMSSLKQTEERSQTLELTPSGTGSVQKQHHSHSAPN